MLAMVFFLVTMGCASQQTRPDETDVEALMIDVLEAKAFTPSLPKDVRVQALVAWAERKMRSQAWAQHQLCFFFGEWFALGDLGVRATLEVGEKNQEISRLLQEVVRCDPAQAKIMYRLYEDLIRAYARFEGSRGGDVGYAAESIRKALQKGVHDGYGNLLALGEFEQAEMTWEAAPEVAKKDSLRTRADAHHNAARGFLYIGEVEGARALAQFYGYSEEWLKDRAKSVLRLAREDIVAALREEFDLK